MLLHPCHLDRSSGRAPEPALHETLRSSSRDLRFRALEGLAEEAGAQFKGWDSAVPDGGSLPKASLSKLGLHISAGSVDSPESGVCVSTALAEVTAAACPQHPEVSVLALAVRVGQSHDNPEDDPLPAGGAVAWLFLVDGGEEQLYYWLHMLGRQGAIRQDLSKEFGPNPKKLSFGTTASVYVVEALRQYQYKTDEASPSSAASALAAKVVRKQADTELRQLEQVDAEVKLLHCAQGHPNVLELFGVFFCGPEEPEEAERAPESAPEEGWGQVYCHVIVTSLCVRGDVYEFVRRKGPLPDGKALEIIKGVLSALAHIHALGIVHRDVKSENVLLDANYQAVLADFGLAGWLSDEEAMHRNCGTPGYAAPELFDRQGPYNEKVDIFSAGVVLYYLLTGITPFTRRLSFQAIMESTIACEVNFPPRQGVDARLEAYALLLVSKSPHDRPSATLALRSMRLLQDAAGDAEGTTDTALWLRKRSHRSPRALLREPSRGSRSSEDDLPQPFGPTLTQRSASNTPKAKSWKLPSFLPGGLRRRPQEEQAPRSDGEEGAFDAVAATPAAASLWESEKSGGAASSATASTQRHLVAYASTGSRSSQEASGSGGGLRGLFQQRSGSKASQRSTTTHTMSFFFRGGRKVAPETSESMAETVEAPQPERAAPRGGRWGLLSRRR